MRRKVIQHIDGARRERHCPAMECVSFPAAPRGVESRTQHAQCHRIARLRSHLGAQPFDRKSEGIVRGIRAEGDRQHCREDVDCRSKPQEIIFARKFRSEVFPAKRIALNSQLRYSHRDTYTVFMRNITLSVDEHVLAVVRRQAAERNETVNSLVREYLNTLAMHEDRASKARARLIELSRESQGRLGRKTWTRGDLHDR